MEIKDHTMNHTKIAEALSAEIIILSTEDGLEILGNLYYRDFDNIIIHGEWNRRLGISAILQVK